MLQVPNRCCMQHGGCWQAQLYWSGHYMLKSGRITILLDVIHTLSMLFLRLQSHHAPH